MAVALLSDEQLSVLLEQAAERGAQKVLDRTSHVGELTTEQAAAELDVVPKTVRKWIRSGRLKPSRKRGNEYRFRRADVEAAKNGPPVSEAARAILDTLRKR
jgi:excisionase family DNA binding protein